MQIRIIPYILLFLISACDALSSSSDEFALHDQAFKVNGIWYSIPRGFFSYESEDPNLTFGEAMNKSSRLEKYMEKEGHTLALNSDKSDRVHGFRFLLMLDPCNDYKVNSTPLLGQVLDACPSLRDCKPTVIEKSRKKQKN